MKTPGAPISTGVPQLLKEAKVSSAPYEVGAPKPPCRPSVSVSAETVMTASSYAAGTCVVAFAPLFPAATTMVTPASRARQIALCNASLFELPQLLSEAPPPPRLRFATVIGPPFFGALLVTKSRPQMTDDHEPEPALFSTRTAQSLAPGATPTTPTPLSKAAIVPATCVPCPFPSL